MKFVLYIILTVGAGFLAQLFLPFWVLAVVGFILALVLSGKRAAMPFFGGFLGGLLLWGGMAFYQQMPHDGILAERVSNLMGFGGLWALISVTALIGALLAGLGSITGYFFRQMLTPSS